MARKELFTTIRTEGAILPSDLLQRIGDLDKALPGLTPADYGLAPTERINEAIARSWSRLQGLWLALCVERDKLGATDPALALTRERWLLPLLDELGYGQVKPRKSSDDLPISHAYDDVPIHLLGVGVPLDKRTPKVPGAAARSPHALVQDYLNNTDALYGFVSNGRTLRLLRDNSSLTRQAFVEFDLEGMFNGEVYPDFSLLWLTCHATRVDGEPPASCFLERWSQAAAEQGQRALDRLRDGVKDALISLGGGFLRHPANRQLKKALRSGELSAQEYYRELLRVVYRLLFLFVAEDRDLLHAPQATKIARARYSRHFSTRRLRELARRHRGGRHPDLWQTVQVVVRALGDPEGLAALGLPNLGGLFAPGQSPFTGDAEIANHELLTAIRALAFTQDGRVVRAVDYRNLGPEEFGSVYESLLELHPEASIDTGAFGFVEAGGSERKTTGSYYTPPSLVQALLDSALDPVVERAAAAVDPEAEILGLRIVDPASGSGHFLIAAAHRLAQRLAAVRSGEGAPAPDEVRRALRDVVGRCIYGVDVNPMAVELCKVSLWIEAVEPGKPLSFLDAHVRCGNSLVGTTPALAESGIPLEAFSAITGDDKEVAKERKASERKRQQKGGVTFAEGAAAERLSALRTAATRISALPDDTPQAVAAKASAYAAFIASDSFQAARSAFDAWCGAFYLPKTDETPEIGSDTVVALLAGHNVGGPERSAIASVARRNRFFQWYLEFPDVMSAGGFDCVIGNPPWDQVQLDDVEYFAVSRPDIAAAGTMAKRKRMLELLKHDDPALYASYRDTRHDMDALQVFIHGSGRFPKTSFGRLNLAPLFAELARALVSERGRVGILVPTGIATDSFNQYFFADLVNTKSLVSLFGFENEEFLFPGIHHATKFCLLTLAGASNIEAPEFLFFARQSSELQEEWRRFTLGPDDFALLNPNTRTCPIFRSRRDAEITKAVYRRVGVFVDENRPDGNPWNFKGLLMFMMNTASHLFRERADLEAEGFALQGNIFSRGDDVYLPLYEGKMIHHFDHRFGTYDGQTESQANQGKLPEFTDQQHCNPALLPLPRYWVHQGQVSKQINKSWSHDWFLGWRDITGAVVQRTVIPSFLPRTAAGNNLPLALISADAKDAVGLVASLSALATDFLARFKVGGTHLNFFIFEQLAVPSPALLATTLPWARVPFSQWLLPRSLELIYTAWDLEGLARDLEYAGPPFRWEAERRFLLRAELDAAFFHFYEISREDVNYILDSFRIVRENEEKRYGSYRTKEVVLNLYDQMATAAESGEPYPTVLDPPPADPRLAHPISTRPSWIGEPSKEGDAQAATVTQLEIIERIPTGEDWKLYAPVVSLKAAAGSFGDAEVVDRLGYVLLPDGIARPQRAFVAQVVGRSMLPTIQDGAWCLFSQAPAGTRQGKILLVQHRDISDPETGGSYTIKRYHSDKVKDSDTLWRHARIRLEPDNPEFEPIILEPDSEEEVRIVGEFLGVVSN